MRVRPLNVAPRAITSEGVSTSPCSRPVAWITTSREATTSPTTAPRISTPRARIGASTAPVSQTSTLLVLSSSPRNSPSMRSGRSTTKRPVISTP